MQVQDINSLRQRQNGRHFADAIFKCIFLNENVWIPIKISLKFVPKGPFNDIPALVQIMAWRRPGDKPLSEPMLVSLPTHICVTRPQWVNSSPPGQYGPRCPLSPKRPINLISLPLPQDKMAVILAENNFKCIFLMKMIEFQFEFHWNSFWWVQLTISQHWFM